MGASDRDVDTVGAVPSDAEPAARSAGPTGPATSATQVPVPAPNSQLRAFLGHLAFLQPRALEAQAAWMDVVDAMFRR